MWLSLNIEINKMKRRRRKKKKYIYIYIYNNKHQVTQIILCNRTIYIIFLLMMHGKLVG